MEPIFQINTELDIPIYQQLVDAIRLAVKKGTLQPDEQLPTVQELSVRLGVARGTIKRAYDELERIGLVEKVAEALKSCEKPITVAVMGCVVNGPGEAREADIGIAGGNGWGMLFEKGEAKEKLPYDQLLPALLERIEKL